MAYETLQNGRYVILKKLGDGRKGIVYKARDTFSNRVTAIKILKSAFLDEEAYLRFLREAQATAKLRHANIVSIYDIGKEDEKQFFVLQLVDGMSLRDLMATYPEGKCDIQTILRTGMDICRALQYAHSQGVLHRDIKPENILITQEGIAKLMDLGLASLLSSLAQVQDIPPKSMILLVGPPGAGKSAFCHWTVLRNLATNKPVIFVTTEHAPSDVIRCLQEKGLSEIPPGTLSFVDAFHETMGLPATSRPDTVNAHCGDLTSIEVAISKLQDKIRTKNISLIFDSLASPYLLNGEEIIKFLRLSLAKFAAKGNQVLACMDEGCGKEEDLGAMMSIANGIIKMELEDGSCVLNVVKHPVVEPTRIRYPTTETLGRPGIAQERIIVGTAAYVAPEIALGKAADARSDLYSFGAVLYEMATGKPPFHGEDPVRNIFSHIHDQPVSPSKLNPKIPQALAECIMKLLEKELGKRYQNAADLLKVLRKIAEGFVREVSVRSLKPSVAVPSPHLPAMKETQLIDRAEEISLLREAVDRVVRGEGRVVFLYGEAGIGKTRLAGELGAYARLRGMQVLYGKCPALFAMDGVPPYVLWKELIKNYLEVSTPEQLYGVIGFYPAEVSKLVPQLRQKLGTVVQSLPISPEHERDRLFEAVSQFLFNISKEDPLLIVLDDLQWADQSSLLLLHYLAHGVYKESLLLLGAYRDTYVDEHHPLSPVLTELNRERLLQSVPLKRLSFDDVLEMIRQILEQDDVSREFCELVYERTRGNPFFVEEVIKSLKEEEVIYREEGKWKIKEVSRIDFPKTVNSVIKKRISRLDNECQNALTLASFVGKDFTFEALRGITGVEEDRLLEIMEKILKTGLVKERVIRGQDVYSFSDIIVKDVVHEGISRLRHNKLHGVVGCSLEKVYAKNIDEHLGELALHFLESGDKEKALDYFLKAGEKAVKVYANSEAASYFQSALRLLEEKEGEFRERGRVLERLGEIKRLVGEHDACMKYWDDALLLWKQLGERRKICRLHRKIANVFWDETGDTEKAKEHYDNALKILETERESIELASLYGDMAHMYYRTGNMAKALSSAEKALELAEKLNGLEVVASSYASLGTIFIFGGDRNKAIACLERALEIALANGQMETALRAYTNLPLSLPAEENERRLECYEKGYELAKKAGHIYHQSWIGNNLAWMYVNMGNTNKAVLLAEESVALDRKAGNISHISMPMGVLGFAYQILGELDKSEQYCQEALSISQRLKDFQSIGISYWSLGWHHFDRGEYVKAREFYEKGCEVYEKAGAKYWQMGYSRWVAWTYVELGEIEKAKNLIDDLRKFALEVKDKELVAAVDALRAMQFRAQKKWKESIEHFEKSIQEHEALDARRWDVYFFAKMVLCEYARVYLERGQEGDREKAHNLLSQALEIFQKIGAKKDIEKIIAKARAKS